MMCVVSSLEDTRPEDGYTIGSRTPMEKRVGYWCLSLSLDSRHVPPRHIFKPDPSA